MLCSGQDVSGRAEEHVPGGCVADVVVMFLFLFFFSGNLLPTVQCNPLRVACLAMAPKEALRRSQIDPCSNEEHRGLLKIS